ncbi:hypothetical protein CVV26_00645 [Candidatus Kuenenbacteria bacterium HGW-Kuenenbacteria-1]|uniref:Response regulatory domain-containing protein n=1 Tax=Candidatus Kuenenbacteria bacterium HGW-Kuenenbacteria-1 TaxID=2013812 RepID=A0A2N1UPC3_9BACT|nr:MAG: hypothetical protein CVV26_00645 [Candidatus Kuenenbacteria bacterium HGW-Kuenenbacteria-1]
MPKRILIIEDEKSIANALKFKLKFEGFDVINAQNGKEAILFLEKETVDFILLDLIMPKMDGFQVLEKLKEIKIKIPVAVLTNLGQLDDEKRAIELGAIAFFVKSDKPIAEIVEWVKEKLK